MEKETVRTKVMLARGDQTPMIKSAQLSKSLNKGWGAYHARSHESLRSCKYDVRSR